MREEFRQLVIEALRRGEDLPSEWAKELFPPEKREYELVYFGKERAEDVIANAMAVPLQPVRKFGVSESGWENMLVFGDNLQVMKTLMRMKDDGLLVNGDGSHGVKVVYIDPPFSTKREFRLRVSDLENRVQCGKAMIPPQEEGTGQYQHGYMR